MRNAAPAAVTAAAPERPQRVLVARVRWRHARDEERLGVAAEPVLQHPRQLGVPVGDVPPRRRRRRTCTWTPSRTAACCRAGAAAAGGALALRERVDDVAQRQEARVDGDALLEARTCWWVRCGWIRWVGGTLCVCAPAACVFCGYCLIRQKQDKPRTQPTRPAKTARMHLLFQSASRARCRPGPLG